MRVRVVTVTVAAAAMLAVVAACGGSSSTPASGSGSVSYHASSQGWTAKVPEGWRSVALGPAFVRGNPHADPTQLVIQAYPKHTPAAALNEFSALHGITVTGRNGSQTGELLTWQRYTGLTTGTPELAVELAVAKDAAAADVAALVARSDEIDELAQSVLLPAIDSFAPGTPAQPASVLATAPAAPDYWPTAGWRTATPADEGMDTAKLDALVAEIRSAKLPVDSVTVIRHGYVVLDRRFGRFAAGTLGEPYADGTLHELQSVTKTVTSMLLGIALHDRAGSGITPQTPVMALAQAVDYTPAHVDARKRAMTVDDLLTMRSGIAWREWGVPYTAASGNDVVGMLATNDWLRYVIDRPMAAQPGTVFSYDTGAAHLVSAAISVLTGKPTLALAEKRLFGPLGISDFRWASDPGGVTDGGFGLQLRPDDLAKLAFLALHRGSWDGRQVVPAAWLEQSTIDRVGPPYEYGYLWWLDPADGYAYMAGLYGQLAVVDPARDVVAVVTAHAPASEDGGALARWLVERYVLPAAG